MKYLIIVCLGIFINHSCDAYEYLYDQDESDLRWLYDNQLYGQGHRNFDFNEDFDDYVPNNYRKSVHYPPIVSYHPSYHHYVDTGSQLDHQWDESLPLYLTYETLPRVQNRPVYFTPPATKQPSTDGYRYPAPETQYLPPSKGPVYFAPRTTSQPSTDGYHYPAPETKYLPPSKEPIPFAPSRKPDVPKTVYLPPKTEYLPPTRKPTRVTPKTTIKTTTTLKPSTPKSLYLPPIVVPEPTIVSEYLPPPPELVHHLQPPPRSASKPIIFN